MCAFVDFVGCDASSIDAHMGCRVNIGILSIDVQLMGFAHIVGLCGLLRSNALSDVL
jgi:hypothetical protein